MDVALSFVLNTVYVVQGFIITFILNHSLKAAKKPLTVLFAYSLSLFSMLLQGAKPISMRGASHGDMTLC